MVKMNVDLGDRGYPIYISTDFSGLDKACKSARLGEKFVIIADSNVEKHYCNAVMTELSKYSMDVTCHTFPAGEQNKNLNTVSDIFRKLISLKLDRNSTLVALGGGVTGDITGFAAATYMRGIPFVQIPTSLLAQADSSIGGKTGVDFEGSKNMVGAFYQPKFVFINVNTLRTLPVRELRAGLAEVIKHGLIMDAEFFDYIEYNIDKIYSFDENVLQYITKMNCQIKGGIIEQDEREEGLRALLNLGHTIGHAVESVSGFGLLHGECVSIGMAGAFRLAQKLGMVNGRTIGRVEGTLEKAGLPVKAPGMDADRILDQMYMDKKIRDGRLYFILPKEIGEVLSCYVDDTELIRQVLAELVQEEPVV